MLAWLNSNAGAVQAIAAVVVAGLTAALVLVTWKYVDLTKQIVKTAQRQLSAAMQPVLKLEILEEGAQFQLGERIKILGKVVIVNLGQQPVKIKGITALVRFKESASNYEQVPYPVTSGDNLVLMPNDPPEIREFLILTDFVYFKAPQDCSLAIGVDCTDLAGVSEHSFFYDSQSGLRHFFGFMKDARHTGFWAKLKRLKARADEWKNWENTSRTT
jgi:hypothetical protein